MQDRVNREKSSDLRHLLIGAQKNSGPFIADGMPEILSAAQQ